MKNTILILGFLLIIMGCKSTREHIEVSKLDMHLRSYVDDFGYLEKKTFLVIDNKHQKHYYRDDTIKVKTVYLKYYQFLKTDTNSLEEITVNEALEYLSVLTGIMPSNPRDYNGLISFSEEDLEAWEKWYNHQRKP